MTDGARVLPSTSAEWADAYDAPSVTVSGARRVRNVVPDGYSLWLVESQLDRGAGLVWGVAHGDEAVAVLDGVVEVDGGRVAGGGVVIVEAGVAAALVVAEPARLLHFGPTDPVPPADGPLGPADPAGHTVHVFDELGRCAIDGGRVAVYYSDAHCPTCRLSLLKNVREPGSRIPSHLHSEDELVYLVAGTAQVGPLTAHAGDVLLVPAGFRYSLRTDDGCVFLNYRRDAAWMTAAPAHPPVLEAIDNIAAFGAALMAG